MVELQDTSEDKHSSQCVCVPSVDPQPCVLLSEASTVVSTTTLLYKNRHVEEEKDIGHIFPRALSIL